jgi:hypothetical protein
MKLERVIDANGNKLPAGRSRSCATSRQNCHLAPASSRQAAGEDKTEQTASCPPELLVACHSPRLLLLPPPSSPLVQTTARTGSVFHPFLYTPLQNTEQATCGT